MFEHIEVTVYNPITERDQVVEFRAFEDGTISRVMLDGSFRATAVCGDCDEIGRSVKLCRGWYGEVKAVKAY